MCGILGVYYSDNRQVNRALLSRMNATMTHRGPDGDGFYFEPGIGLAHRRLSIIDLAGGKQPLCNEDGRVWITFNGEIYNFQELRKELETSGHRFSTDSDTEVIVHAYEEFGDSCVEHLRGMFAFAIWDGRRQRLFLARDRVGIKPLYYYSDEGQLIFASELKAICANSTVAQEIDLAALREYLLYGYIPCDKVIFQRAQKLLPGHFLVVERNPQSGKLSQKVEQYWDLQFCPEHSLSEQDWIEGFRQLLYETVKLHLVSDVPLGAFLSGGLDSSCVVAVMSSLMNAPVKTFSVGFAEEDFSELPYARLVANLYETEHHELLVRPDAIELLPTLARQFDEPFGDSSAIPTYLVSKLARKHVTVSLSGDGGDELFGGYRRYAHTMATLGLQNKLRFLPASLRMTMFSTLTNRLPSHIRGAGLLRRMGMSTFDTYMDIAYCQSQTWLSALLHADINAVLNSNGQSDLFRTFFRGVKTNDDLTRMQYLDTKTYLPEDILTKVDRTSMLTSLEARVPLLDHKILEFVARIPANLKFRQGQGKYIFKRFLQGLLPPELLTRHKMGFGVPLVHWFKSDLEGYARDILLSQRSKERGYFNPSFIEGMLVEHKKGQLDRSQDIWRLLVFEHWCRNYLDSAVYSVFSQQPLHV